MRAIIMRMRSPPHVDLFLHVFLLEEHASEESLHGHLVAFAPLAEPVHEVHVALEELGVVERQVGGGDGHAPLVGAGVGLPVAVDDFEEGCHGLGVMAEEHHLLALLHVEAHVVEEHGAVGVGGLESFHLENLVAGFAVHLEDDAGILAR